MRTRSRLVGVLSLSVALAICIAAPPLIAEDQNMSVNLPQMSEPPDSATVRAVDSALWREHAKELSTMPNSVIQVLSEKNLKELAAGEDPATIRTMSGASVESALAIGSAFDELVFTPISPCRVVDTRFAVGPFAPNEIRSYNILGLNNYSIFGGNAAGCGLPGVSGGGVFSINTVRALAVNIVAVSPTGPGHFVAWPTGQPEPSASVINFTNISGFNIANGLDLATCPNFCLDLTPPFTCGDPCPAGDLSFHAAVSSVHLIVDVLGYFTAATTSGVAGTSTEGNFGPGGIALVEDVCTELVSCSITNNSTSSVGVVVTGNVNVDINHILATHDEINASLSTASAVCDLYPTGPGGAWYDVNNNVPSGCCWQGHLSVSKRFSLAAETSQTYYLNAVQVSGGGDSVISANIICLLDR